jgi:Flp pilus assembly protein TadD
MPSVIGSTPVDPAPGLRSFLPLPAACAAGLAVLVYVNALENPFVYDDFHLIVENTSILNPTDLQSVIVRDITRPIVALSYALDARVWGQNPLGYHLTNLLLHATNVLLVFWVARVAAEDRSRQNGPRAWPTGSSSLVGFATAALLAVHPMMTQAVGYISGRSEVAYSMFFLLAFLAGRRWMLGGGARWWTACVGFWIVALLTKESAAMLPVVLVAYDWLVLDAPRAERRRRFLRLALPMLAVTLAAGVGRVGVLLFVEYPGQSAPDWRFALVAVDAFWRYLAMLFSPRHQSIFHAVPAIDSVLSPRAIGGLVGLAGFVVAAWRLRPVHSLIALGLMWFACLLVPSSALLVLGRGEAMAEHRVYLSAVGMFLAWGCAFASLWARSTQRTLVGIGAAIFVAALGFQTVVRNAIWRDPVRLSREAVSLAPGHWMPRVLAADALRQSGRCADAVPEYRAAIVFRAVEEYPYTMLARCLIQERRFGEAEQALRLLRVVNPASQEASMGLGIFALLSGRTEEARGHFQEVLARDGTRAQARLLLAFLDGSLPDADRSRVCDALRTVAGATSTIAACPGGAP